MLEFVKNYYVFVLILMVLSYLVPKDDYKKYIQFFIGIFVIVLLLKPILQFFFIRDNTILYEAFEELNERMELIDFQIEEKEDMFEYFFFKGEGQ
ncbi:MAG: stage III sporulation protein AF [Lachnospiraceae bacterium]|nr:stage III sporulation protein AF [Lachnospiraceae bacterium]